jgi:two-component system phosphate regulon sensor histidine kinase PhoR
MAAGDQSAKVAPMAALGENERALVNAIDEAAFIVAGNLVVLANPAAQLLLGERIEGRDVRLAIRHPQALDLILSNRSGDVDASGIVEPGRSWRIVIRRLPDGAAFVRMIDRSASVSAEKMRVDFVANASHELRTPLSTVIGYAETLAEDGDLPSEMRSKFGRTIRDEARRMLRIIEDLMSLSRIEADRFIAPADQIEVADIVGTAVANANHLRNTAGCELRVDLKPNLPALRGDRAKIIQLLENLIGNAVRYGCDGSSATIDISADRDDGWTKLMVQDHGPGIPREHLPRLTERFYRADAARSRETGGTGLGLAIVKHIVERHRGLLDIRSEIGAGTTVIVRLPTAG